MSRHRRTTALGAVSVLALGSALTGCAAGFDAVTSQPYAAADGVMEIEEELRVTNVLVVGNEEGQARVLLYATTDLGTRLDDNDGDELLDVDLPGAAEVEIVGETAVPSHGALSFQDPRDDGSILVTGLEQSPGEAITVELIFAKAGRVVANTIVVPPTGYYEGYLTEATVPEDAEPTGEPGGVFPTEGATAPAPPAPVPSATP